MNCRQCEPWKSTGELTQVEAIDHLVEVHPGRAATFIKRVFAFASGYGSVMSNDLRSELDDALAHRSEYPNTYGVYE